MEIIGIIMSQEDIWVQGRQSESSLSPIYLPALMDLVMHSVGERRRRTE